MCVQYLLDHNIEHNPKIVYQDVNRAISFTHKSGELHEAIISDCHRYIAPNKRLEELLLHMKSFNRKLFILTNNSFKYVDAGMNHLIGSHWREHFDLVMCDSRKPHFFKENDFTPFREIHLSNKTLLPSAARELTKGKVYSQVF